MLEALEGVPILELLEGVLVFADLANVVALDDGDGDGDDDDDDAFAEAC